MDCTCCNCISSIPRQDLQLRNNLSLNLRDIVPEVGNSCCYNLKLVFQAFENLDAKETLLGVRNHLERQTVGERWCISRSKSIEERTVSKNLSYYLYHSNKRKSFIIPISSFLIKLNDFVTFVTCTNKGLLDTEIRIGLN